jgi:transposase
MSQREVERVSIIEQVIRKQLKQGQAGKLLRVSPRQIRRMVSAYRREGAAGLVSKRRGRASNRRGDEQNKADALQLVRTHYPDFGPTLVAEKLCERHGLSVNKETLRQWMIVDGLWHEKRRKKAKVHQSRQRRSCIGELVQLDGSHHDWFEGQRPPCCLYVLIDDATSQLVGLWFAEQETTRGYFHVVQDYLIRCGRPLAFYSDKHSIFRINQLEVSAERQTQFERAMQDLDIELIHADSPQAKGRVERANGTLQDRLVKEMRLRGINTLEAANAFLPAFMADYNRRFAVVPASPVNAHRHTLPTEGILGRIFSLQHIRTLSKNLELSYQGTLYQVKTTGVGYGLRHAKVVVCEDAQGQVSLWYQGRCLPYTRYDKAHRVNETVNAKQVTARIDRVVVLAKPTVPVHDHPWRRYVLKANPVNDMKKRSYPQGPQGA